MLSVLGKVLVNLDEKETNTAPPGFEIAFGHWLFSKQFPEWPSKNMTLENVSKNANGNQNGENSHTGQTSLKGDGCTSLMLQLFIVFFTYS